MRSSQWFIIGIFLIVISLWFIRQDTIAQDLCGVAGRPPDAAVIAEMLEQVPEEQLEKYPEPLTAPKQLTMEEWLEKGSEPVDRVSLWCINTEIYDPFILLLQPLGIVFIICGWIELMTEKRRKRRKK